MTDPSASRQAPENSNYRELLTSIVQRFTRLAGSPAALSVARRIPGLSVDNEGKVTAYTADDPLGTLVALVDEYESAVGAVARTLVHQAASSFANEYTDRILKEAGLTPP